MAGTTLATTLDMFYYLLFCMLATDPTPRYIATFDGVAPKTLCSAAAEGFAAALSDEQHTAKCVCKPETKA